LPVGLVPAEDPHVDIYIYVLLCFFLEVDTTRLT